MNNLPNCPKCNSEYVYEDGALLVCPECAYEWNPAEVADVEEVLLLSMPTEINWLTVIQ